MKKAQLKGEKTAEESKGRKPPASEFKNSSILISMGGPLSRDGRIKRRVKECLQSAKMEEMKKDRPEAGCGRRGVRRLEACQIKVRRGGPSSGTQWKGRKEERKCERVRTCKAGRAS